jgi:transcriptional regulator with XRE-family HTH domain
MSTFGLTLTATIKDVAEEAGVSTATVSRVLNTPQKVAPETLEAVVAAIAKLRYSPNSIAAEFDRLQGQREKFSSESTHEQTIETSGGRGSESRQQSLSTHRQIQSLKTENRRLKRVIREFKRHLGTAEL